MGARRKTSKADYGTKAQQMANANPTTCALPNYGDGFPEVKARCKQIMKHSTGQYNMPYTDQITGKIYANAQDSNGNLNPALTAQIQTDEANFQQSQQSSYPQQSYQPAYQPNVSQYQPQYQPAYVNPQSQYQQQQYQPQYVDPNAGVGYIDPNGPGYGNQSIPDPNADPMAADSLQSESLANQEAESGGETLAQQQADFYNSADGEPQIMGVKLTPVKVIGGVLVLGLVGVAAFYGYKKFKKGK